MAVVTTINPQNRTRPIVKILKPDQAEDIETPELDLMASDNAHIHILRTLDTSHLQDSVCQADSS